MTDEEFRALLDRHGADLGVWPAGLARDARRLLAVSTRAQSLLDEMVGIELALSAPEEAAPPSDLADRIFERAFGDARGPGIGEPGGGRGLSRRS